MSSEREMTLKEWVERLPEIHLARREYDRLAAENERLKEESDLQMDRADELAVKNKQLCAENEKLKKNAEYYIWKCGDEGDKWEKENLKLRTAYDTLAAENELLKAQGNAQTNLDLSIQVSHLIAENEQLKKKIDRMASGSHEIIEENEKLRTENERLKEVISFLPKVPTEPYEKELAKEVERLRAENAELIKTLKELIEIKMPVQIYRSQGCDGPWNEYEKFTSKLVDKVEKEYSGASLMTPWLWTNNGWTACMEYLRTNQFNKVKQVLEKYGGGK